MDCPKCSGSGHLYADDPRESVTCSLCHGSGELPDKKLVRKK